jgi:hypothetical protein
MEESKLPLIIKTGNNYFFRIKLSAEPALNHSICDELYEWSSMISSSLALL